MGKRVKGEGKELNIGTNLKKGKNMLLGYEKKNNFPGRGRGKNYFGVKYVPLGISSYN